VCYYHFAFANCSSNFEQELIHLINLRLFTFSCMLWLIMSTLNTSSWNLIWFWCYFQFIFLEEIFSLISNPIFQICSNFSLGLFPSDVHKRLLQEYDYWHRYYNFHCCFTGCYFFFIYLFVIILFLKLAFERSFLMIIINNIIIKMTRIRIKIWF